MTESRYYSDWEPIINRIFADSKKNGFNIRLAGGLAIYFHCETQKKILEKFERKYADADFVCLSKDILKIKEYFTNHDYILNVEVFTYSEGKRMIFESQLLNSKIEVFVDELMFCHMIDLKDRLMVDYPTISLSDLFLSKMQIVMISDKDLLDLTVLILEHQFSDNEQKDCINMEYIAKLLSDDWGFYYTFSNNIKRFFSFVQNCDLTNKQKEIILQKINQIDINISKKNKSLKWKLRAVIGTKLKWYKDVSEI